MNRSDISRFVKGRTWQDYTIAIAYDGERTEDEYFRGWKLVIPPNRLTLIPIFVRSGGNPLIAAQKAAKAKKKLEDFAEFWCITDCDDATESCIEEAKTFASSQNIRLALSRRCFEIWFLLHFTKHTKPITNEAEAIEAVREHINEYDQKQKIAPFSKLLPLTDQAISNAEWLAESEITDPATNVHCLVRKFRDNLRPPRNSS